MSHLGGFIKILSLKDDFYGRYLTYLIVLQGCISIGLYKRLRFLALRVSESGKQLTFLIFHDLELTKSINNNIYLKTMEISLRINRLFD